MLVPKCGDRYQAQWDRLPLSFPLGLVFERQRGSQRHRILRPSLLQSACLFCSLDHLLLHQLSMDSAEQIAFWANHHPIDESMCNATYRILKSRLIYIVHLSFWFTQSPTSFAVPSCNFLRRRSSRCAWLIAKRRHSRHTSSSLICTDFGQITRPLGFSSTITGTCTRPSSQFGHCTEKLADVKQARGFRFILSQPSRVFRFARQSICALAPTVCMGIHRRCDAAQAHVNSKARIHH